MSWLSDLFDGGDDEMPSYSSIYSQRKDPRIADFMNMLEGRAKNYLTPGYEALNPSQQNMIYNRIKSQLQPTFDEGIQSQLQNIQGMGIEGTPGAAILSKLRKDYANDLSGRATDVAMKNIDLTRSDIGKGEDILGQLRSSLLNEAQSTAGLDYSGEMQDYQNEQNSNNQFWSTLGNLGGTVASLGLAPATGGASLLALLNNRGSGTTGGMMDILGSSDMFGGKRKTRLPNFVTYGRE